MTPDHLQNGKITEGWSPGAESLVPACRPHPSKLFVETTTRCNFNCEMCIKHAPASEIREGDLSPATFAALEPAFPHLEALILSGIGEPLLHPHLERFIRQAKSLMPAGSWVGFQSNGSLLDLNRARSLVDAGLDRICLSLDSVHEENFCPGAGGEGIAEAFAILAAARAEGRGDLTIGVEIVLRRDNVGELPDMVSWAAAHGAKFVIVTHLVPYGEAHLSQTAYDINNDAAYRLFSRWQPKAAAAGLDLSRYHIARFLRSSHPDRPPEERRTPEEQVMVDLVDEMLLEAHSQGIFLHLPKLLARDEGLLAEVAQSFAAAEAVARRTGLDLKLPAVMPRRERKCDFIEGGGAFISWDGQVHPCYFLWHRYCCHASGWEKFITPTSFGNLTDGGILEIWNEPTFRSFRQAVVGYDFPFCANCSLSPCDYVYSPEFTQDCYVNQVPCGDCLWCTGLFHCML